MLLAKGCEIDTTDSNGDSLLHLCARKQLEKAAIYLVNKNAKINLVNQDVSIAESLNKLTRRELS